MDQIEVLLRLILCDIGKPEFDVGQLLCSCLATRDFELASSISVATTLPLGLTIRATVERNVTAAASNF
jgi:hypothetical protein